MHRSRILPLLLLLPLALPSLFGCDGTQAHAHDEPAPDQDDTGEVALPALNESMGEVLSEEERAVFLAPDSVEFFTIEPTHASASDDEEDQPETLHGYPIISRKKLEDRAHVATLFGALYDAVADGGDPASCFNPRHGLRITKGEMVVELVICFQCSGLHIHSGTTPEARESSDSHTLGTEGDAVFNRVAEQLEMTLSEN